MGWRLLSIENAGKLSLKENQLVFSSDLGKKTVPIEDLECVLLENQQIEISHPLLNKLAEEGVLLVTMDAKHQASGMLVSYWGQYQKLAVLTLQLNTSQPLKKRCWQKIIIQKIHNQALLFEKLQMEGASELYALAKTVQSGDAGNVEAISSAYYFKRLFSSLESPFVRMQHYDKNIDLLNAGLNYCYALVRAVLTRHIVASGLLPYLGIQHHSKVNAFNLADDLIEPYRAMVDEHVYSYLDYFLNSADLSLSAEIRQNLQKIFMYQLHIDKTTVKFPASCRQICASYIRAMEMQDATLLKLPHNWHLE